MINRKTMFGFIKEFYQDEKSSTGYCVKMFIDQIDTNLHTFPVTRQVYDMQPDPDINSSLIGQYCFSITFDNNGVITKLEPSIKTEIKAAYSFGSTEAIGSVLTIGDDYIEFTNFEEQYKNGRIDINRNSTFPRNGKIENGMRISLSSNVTIYCLDWTGNDITLSPVNMDFLKKVVNENVYWMDIQNVYGNNNEYDCVMIFRFHKKRETSLWQKEA